MNTPVMRSSVLSSTSRVINSAARSSGANNTGISDQASQHREGLVAQTLEDSVQQRAQDNPRTFRNALEQAYGGKADPVALDKMASMVVNGKLPMPQNVVFVDAGTLSPGSLGAYDDANGGTV